MKIGTAIIGFYYCFIFILLTILAPADDFFHTTTPLPIATQMYGAVVLGDYLYVIGGNSYVPGTVEDLWQTSVWRAFIYPDGSLEKWEKCAPIPHNRSYIENQTIVLNDVVYALCGYDGKNETRYKNILWTRPLPNGELEPWRESPPCPGQAVNCAVAVSTPGYIHLIAGRGEKETALPDVWSAQIAADGTVLGWEPAPFLPAPLWFHHAGVVGGRVWVWGGLKGNSNKSVNDNIYFSEILPSGRLGKWEVADKKLNPAFFGAACAVSGDFLLSFFPRYAGGETSYDIVYSTFDGKVLSDWGLITAGTKARLYTSVATDYRNNILFLPGGRIEHGPKAEYLDSTVYCFRIKPSDKSAAVDATPTPALLIGIASGARDQTARLSYTYHTITTGIHRGFHTYEKSREIFEKKNRPVVIYFYTKTARNCVKQGQILQEQFNPATYGDAMIFAELDGQNYPQLSQQYGVFRFPAWVFFNSRGKEIGRKVQALEATELDALVRYVLQSP
ncbi:hypothetical protein JW926_12460 [Candidatus Sumerlaeota bacterium]|nr:hypothetical protein [Candidatus Sumerlaeota bacterium]